MLILVTSSEESPKTLSSDILCNGLSVLVMRCQGFHVGLHPGEKGMKQLSGQRSLREKCTVRHPCLCRYDEASNLNHFSQTYKRRPEALKRVMI